MDNDIDDIDVPLYPLINGFKMYLEGEEIGRDRAMLVIFLNPAILVNSKHKHKVYKGDAERE